MMRFKMRILCGWCATLALLLTALLVPSRAAAQDDITVTKHNFSTLSGRNAAFTDLSSNVADYGALWYGGGGPS